MEIVFLGTSAGAPTKQRNVSATALVESGGKDWHLIDCGEATQHQIHQSHLSLNCLSSIFITHVHGDHVYGLPGLLASAGLNGRTLPLKIIAPEMVRQWIEATIEMSGLYLPFELEWVVSSMLTSIEIGQFSVSVVALSHRIECYGYVFKETKTRQKLNIEDVRASGIPQGPLWGRLLAGEDIEHEGVRYQSIDFIANKARQRKVVICGDNDKPELLSSVCENCDVLIHEATFGEELADKAQSVGHSYAASVAAFAQNAAVPNLVLTHFSARYSASMRAMELEAQRVYKGHLYLACDFDLFRLSPSLKFERVDAVKSEF